MRASKSTSDLIGTPSISFGADGETNNRSTANDPCPKGFHEPHGFFDCVTLRMMSSTMMQGFTSPWFTILTKHSFTVHLLGPVDLFCTECIAYNRGHRNSAELGTYYCHLGQLTRDIFLESKLPAQGHSKNHAQCRSERKASGIWK
jgi:hypothetical protein